MGYIRCFLTPLTKVRVASYAPEAVIRTMLKDNSTISRADAKSHLLALFQWMCASTLCGPDLQFVMYSQVVDDAHHAFILNTRLYHQFCDEFFGGNYFHHDPFDAEVTPLVNMGANIEFTFNTLTSMYGTELSPLLKARIDRHRAGDSLTVAEICCLSKSCSSPGVQAMVEVQ